MTPRKGACGAGYEHSIAVYYSNASGGGGNPDALHELFPWNWGKQSAKLAA
jgi:hypothetical protein